MLKLQSTSVDSGQFHNFRCGEVICVDPKTYHVSCALCGQKVLYQFFPQHFSWEHLSQCEEECKDFNKDVQLAKQQKTENEVVEMVLKAEDDPIGAEESHDVSLDLAHIRMLDTECAEEASEKTEDNDADSIEEDTIKLKSMHTSKPQQSTIAPKQLERIDEENTLVVTRRSRRAVNKNTESGTNDEEETVEICEENTTDEAYDDVVDNDVDSLHDMRSDPDWQENEVVSAQLDVHSDVDDDDHVNGTNPDLDMLFSCNVCDRRYNSLRGLQYHKRMKHNSAPRIRQTKSKKKLSESPKEFKCDDCDQVFRRERDLKGHRWKHTGIFCDICGKPFSQTGNMTRHRVRHTGIKAFKCKDCDSSFYTNKELKSHSICHTKTMPVICEICGRPCRDRGVLTAHMRRHTGERPAKCEVCGKSFYSFHDLNVHAVAHTSERPFACDVCGSTFQRKKALRVHKLLHSDQRKYICKICGKAFAQSGGLNAHMRTHDATAAKAIVATRTVNTVDGGNGEITVAIETMQWE